MRCSLRVTTFLASLTTVAQSLPAQVNFDTVKITTKALRTGVYLLQGAGGNIGLSIGADAAFLIDDQFAELSPKILAAVKALTDKPLRFVVNTHWHGDHTGGNLPLGEAGVIIVAHDNVRTRMSTEQFLAAFNSRTPPSPPKALPVVTFAETIAFHLNGEDIHVVHVPPAHTDGDAIIHFSKANVLHLGDTFFNGMYPFIDVSTGGSQEGMVGAANAALRYANDSTMIIPGHGPLATRADLVAYRDMMVQVRDRVAALIKAGKTKEQAVAAKPLADLDAKWGKGFLQADMFVGIVYDSMKK